MKKILFSLFIFIVLSNESLFCDDFYLKIYYLKAEKSKDSHSSEEYITVKGNDVTYSIFYTGTRGKYDVDTDKSCVFSNNNIENIKNTIITGELNVTDSLFEENIKYKEFEIYCNINIDIRMGGNAYSIKINGNIDEFHDKSLYKNTIFLISIIREMLSGC